MTNKKNKKQKTSDKELSSVSGGTSVPVYQLNSGISASQLDSALGSNVKYFNISTSGDTTLISAKNTIVQDQASDNSELQDYVTKTDQTETVWY
jgi:hypothetical protein